MLATRTVGNQLETRRTRIDYEDIREDLKMNRSELRKPSLEAIHWQTKRPSFNTSEDSQIVPMAR